MVVCSVCGVEKPVAEFYARKDSPTGYRRDCKACVTARIKRHRVENSEAHRARDRARYRTPHRQAYYRTPAMLAYRKAYNAVYFVEHGAAVRERQGKQIRALYSAVRRARKVSGASLVTERDLQRLIQRHGGLCVYCGGPWEHIEHVVPLARGGRHTIGNLLPACAACNRSKNKSLLTEWRLRLRTKESAWT